LVQLASESLCKLDGVNVLEEKEGNEAYLPIRMPAPKQQRPHNAMGVRDEIKNDIFRSFGKEGVDNAQS
jgi:hypothetical protein